MIILAALAICTLTAAGDEWQGKCGPIDGEMPVITVTRTDAITSGTWRKEAKPKKVFAGVSDVTGDLNQPVELEIYRGNSGVLRTVYKWVPVTNFRSSAKALRFDIDTSADVKPSLLDRDIVRRAAAMLSSDAVWNRHDNRKCPKDAATHSIYCAMIDASIAVTGGFNHRRPAMEAVRAIVDERSAGRPYHHRLMDYNNDPKTTLGDVQSLFAEALRRMK